MNWIFGDNINTDLITPGRYNITTDPAKLKAIAFIEYRPEFAQHVQAGDFVIGGKNFGCGSSRETAAIALQACGVRVIFAKSFARIFYRNCMNQGLLAILTDTSAINETDILQFDEHEKLLTNVTKNTKTPLDVPEMMMTLHEVGGIVAYIQKYGLSSISTLVGKV